MEAGPWEQLLGDGSESPQLPTNVFDRGDRGRYRPTQEDFPSYFLVNRSVTRGEIIQITSTEPTLDNNPDLSVTHSVFVNNQDCGTKACERT